MLLLKTVRYIAGNVAPRIPPDSLVEYLSKTIAFTITTVGVLPEFSDLVHAQPEVAIAVFMSVREAVQPPYPSEVLRSEVLPSEVLPSEAYQPIETAYLGLSKPMLAKCTSKETCRWVGTPYVRCKMCKATWEDQRTRYYRSVWRYYPCRVCGKLETPETLEILGCPECKGGSLAWSHFI